jgi:CSLREA domain-containing protein
MSGKAWAATRLRSGPLYAATLALAIAGGLSVGSPVTWAATIAVDEDADEVNSDGDCSLREALQAVNLNVAVDGCPAGSDTATDEIQVPAGTYTLMRAGDDFPETGFLGDLDITDNTAAVDLVIAGAGAGTTTIQACTVDQKAAPCPAGQGIADRVFHAQTGTTATIRGFTIRNGNASGAGILNRGTLTLSDSVVTRNQNSAGLSQGGGGGVSNFAVLTVIDSVISENDVVGEGGGIQTRDTLNLVRSTVSGNRADCCPAGGISVFTGTMTATSSTVADNFAGSSGGGLVVRSGTTAVLINSTVSGNDTNFNGGGIIVTGGGTLTLSNSTVTNNRAIAAASDGRGGGIFNAVSTINLKNTIVAGNFDVGVGGTTTPSDCSDGTLVSQGFNLVGEGTGCTGATDGVNGDQVGTSTSPIDPQLGALVDNGGSTLTHALLPGGPAIDAGDPAGCTDHAGLPLVLDQRGELRTVDGDGDGGARCDGGAFELGGGVGLSFVIRPNRGGDEGLHSILFYGAGFADGTAVKLTRSGEPDILPEEVEVRATGDVLAAVFDLTGRTLGSWDAVVANPGGAPLTVPDAFLIEHATAPDVWVDVVGPESVRVGVPARYTVLYGNRGNTDALAVPLVFSAADALTVEPLFAIAPPPKQFGKFVISEFGHFYESIVVGNDQPLQQFILLLPIVPAGLSGTLEVLLTAPTSTIGSELSVLVERADPLFEGDVPKPDALAKLTGGARDKSERLFGFTIPTSIDPELTDYIATQLEIVVGEGRGAFVASFGTDPKVYSLTQLGYDLMAFGIVRTHVSSSLQASAARFRSDLVVALLSRVADQVYAFGAAPAYAQGPVCGDIGADGKVISEGCTYPKEDDFKPPKNCLKNPKDKDCKRPENPGECRNIGFFPVRHSDGSLICTNDPRCVLPNPLGPVCIRFPIKPVRSADPNDKSGPPGGGDAHFITTELPLPYTIQFENLPTATAPAAEVVVTDQLDRALLDLATLSLGPIAFGSHRVVPPPGLTTFQQDVDLRPETNLIVRIDAKLDAPAALLTWRLTSLDPATMQPPTDPLAGFLPPNTSPPQGSGHVLFTVAAQPSLATGAQIANQARIFFDANDPIDTPVWSNSIDLTPPTSEITSVAPSGACAKDLAVSWSGADLGSAVEAFDISASEDGGPFLPWLATTSGGDTFHGKWGKRYAFRSVAQDQAGNVETDPSSSDPVTVSDCGPHDLAVTKIVAPKVVKLTSKRPADTVLLKVQIQNRGANAETILDEVALAGLVTLTVDSLAGGCPSARIELHSGKPQKVLPLTLAPKKKLNVVFAAVFDCANDAAKGAGHEDFTLSATVSQAVLGGEDAHVIDDTCPRTVSPSVKDPFPDGKIVEKGCGAKQPGGTLGSAVLLDVVVQ